MLFQANLSLCIASHSVHLELATVAVGLFELALQGAQSRLRGRLCLVVDVPALLVHDRVAAKEVLIVAHFAWERGVQIDCQTSQKIYPTIIVELGLAEVAVLTLVDSVAVAREGGLGDGARAEALDVHQVVRRIHYAEGNPV